MSCELFSASPAIVNYSVVNYSRQGKLRRLWRLAVATQPPIADNLSVPLRGTMFRWMYRTYPQRRCFAACSGFHDIGPAPWNPQLIVIHKQTIYKQKKALCQVGEKLVRARPNIKPFT